MAPSLPRPPGSENLFQRGGGHRFGIALFVCALLLASVSRAAAPEATTALSPFWAAVLGALQGATEFLPVSSSGHLALGQAWLGIDPATAGHRFNIIVHAGTLVAVVWVYRSDVRELLRVLVRPTVASEHRTQLLMMLLASLPLGIVLIPAVENLVIGMESQVRLIGLALWVTAAILFFAFRNARGDGGHGLTGVPTVRQAILIGCAQVFAVLPGISRSGTTIAAGLAVGLGREAAARFSFLISLIAVGGATFKEGVELASEGGAEGIDPFPYAMGFVVSLVVGLLSLRGLLYLVSRGRVGVFVAYLLVVGGVAVALG